MKNEQLLIYKKSKYCGFEEELINAKKMLLLFAGILSYMEEEEFTVTKQKAISSKKVMKYKYRKYVDEDELTETIIDNYIVYAIRKGEEEIANVKIQLEKGDEPDELAEEVIDSELFFYELDDLFQKYPYIYALIPYTLSCDPKDFTIKKIIDYIAPVLDNHKKVFNKKIRIRIKNKPDFHTMYQNVNYRELEKHLFLREK